MGIASLPAAPPAAPPASRGWAGFVQATALVLLAPLVVLLPWSAHSLLEFATLGARDIPGIMEALSLVALVLAKGFPVAYGWAFWKGMCPRRRPGAPGCALGWTVGLPAAWLACLAALLALLHACALLSVRVSQVLI